VSTFPIDFLKKAFRWVATATIARGMFPWVAGATGIVGLSLGLIAPAQAQTAQFDSPISRNVFNCMKDNNSNAQGRATYSGTERNGAESGQMSVFDTVGIQQGTIGYNFVITTPGRPARPARGARPATPATPDKGRLQLSYVNGPFVLTREDFLGRVRDGLQNTANTTCRGR
jgi:hypothetical protein